MSYGMAKAMDLAKAGGTPDASPPQSGGMSAVMDAQGNPSLLETLLAKLRGQPIDLQPPAPDLQALQAAQAQQQVPAPPPPAGGMNMNQRKMLDQLGGSQ